MSSSKLGKLVAIYPKRNRSRTVFTPLRSPGTSLTPPSPPLAEKNSTELLRMTLRFYKGRVTVSVRPPSNNRRVSVQFHRRTFGERHGCTKGPVPLSRVNLRMTTDEGFAAVLRSAGKLHGGFKWFKTSVALLRSGASVKLPGRCPNSSFLFPNASLSTSVTFPDGCAPIVVRRSYGRRNSTVVKP